MFVAMIDFETASSDRATALDVLLRAAPTFRALPDNVDYRVLTDATRDDCVSVVHEWRTAEALATYLASDAFAALGAQLRPLMTAAPVSRRMRLADGETV